MDRFQAARELGVPPTAAPEQVERAFRAAARRRHPDVGGDAAGFHRAIEARACLLRPATPDPMARASRAVAVVIRYHPVVRLVEVLVRVADRRPVR